MRCLPKTLSTWAAMLKALSWREPLNGTRSTAYFSTGTDRLFSGSVVGPGRVSSTQIDRAGMRRCATFQNYLLGFNNDSATIDIFTVFQTFVFLIKLGTPSFSLPPTAKPFRT